MPEFVNKISTQLTEFWNRFSRKQKIQIVAVFAVIVAALVILVLVLSRPNMVLYASGLEPAKTNQIIAEFDKQGIPYTVSEDATSVYVEASRKKDAILALDTLGILSNAGMTQTELFTNGLMTTETEKLIKYKLFLQTDIADKIAELQVVDEAKVTLVIPEDDRTILDEAKQSKASVVIKTNGTINNDQIEGIANLLAAAVPNLELSGVRIIDTDGKLLYNGSTMEDGNMNLGSRYDYEALREAQVQNNVTSLLLARGEYDDAEVIVDLVLNFDEQTKTSEVFTLPEGQTKPIPGHETISTSESTNTDTGAAPGTDTNSGTTTTYPSSTGSDSSTSSKDSDIDYRVNSEVTSQVKSVGDIVYENSTLSVVLNKFVYYDYAILKKQGTLDNTTWAEYKAANQTRTKGTVDTEIIDSIKAATNIPNIKVMAYNVPQFIEAETKTSPISDYILIGVIVVMVGLLGYAVYKGTEPVEITEIEPELSVEDMLASTKEKQELETIEYDGKSESRVQIEKFVDDNPAAVALLMRNWLNEDWE